MNNKDFYNDKPLREALAAYDKADEMSGGVLSFHDWLSLEAFKEGGKYVWSGEQFVEVGAVLAQIENPKPVTGYLLEFRSKRTGEWIPCEFDCGYYPDLCDAEWDAWEKMETQVGFFPELGTAWLACSEDWGFRLGADFNAEKTPKETPNAHGVWSGDINDNGWRGDDCDRWRVRRMTIHGALSETAKEFFRNHPWTMKGLYKD